MNSQVPLLPCDVVRDEYLDSRGAATATVRSPVDNTACGRGPQKLLAMALWDSQKSTEDIVVWPDVKVGANIFKDEVVYSQHRLVMQYAPEMKMICIPAEASMGVEATMEPFRVMYLELALFLIICTLELMLSDEVDCGDFEV